LAVALLADLLGFPDYASTEAIATTPEKLGLRAFVINRSNSNRDQHNSEAPLIGCEPGHFNPDKPGDRSFRSASPRVALKPYGAKT
jgi:hypothetical protein